MNHLLGLLSWFPFFTTRTGDVNTHSARKGTLLAAGVHQCRALLQAPSCPGIFVTALAVPVRWVEVELSVGSPRSILFRGTKLEGEQLWNLCCAGERFSMHSLDQAACLLDMLLVFVYCEAVQELLWRPLDEDLCCGWYCVNMWSLQTSFLPLLTPPPLQSMHWL